MATYRMEDGTIVKTENAHAEFQCKDDVWDGNNHRCRITGDQWTHQILYRSRKGRYYIVHVSQWQGSTRHAEWVSPQEATRWLIKNGNELPDDLKKFEDEVSE